MISIHNRLMAALVLTLALAAAAAAQQAQPAPAPAAKEPDYVQEKGFKTKIIEVKYRDPMSLQRVIMTLGSGVRGAAITPNSEFKTLTVRDYPENIATIEEAVRRLDTPEAARPDIELHIHILIAWNVDKGGNEYPAELNDVIKQLHGTLAYKSYSLMASAIQRAKESGRGGGNSGVADGKLFNIELPPGSPVFYEYNLESIVVQPSAGGPNQVQITNFVFNMRVPLNVGSNGNSPAIQYQNVGFRTPVSVREGEKVVVGTTTMGDKGLIVVLSARVLNK